LDGSGASITFSERAYAALLNPLYLNEFVIHIILFASDDYKPKASVLFTSRVSISSGTKELELKILLLTSKMKQNQN